MSGWTKLFSSIVTSSVWVEPDAILRVWIAMLATADADGIVEGSVPGFANLARVTTAQMRDAITVLTSSDPDSRTPDHEGRRIEAIEGGWRLLNYLSYRDRGQSKDGRRAPALRRYREGVRARRAAAATEGTRVGASTTSSTAVTGDGTTRYPEARSKKQDESTEQERTSPSAPRARAAKVPDASALEAFDRFWAVYPNHVKKADARKVWLRLKPDAALVERIIAAVSQQRESSRWREAGGRFVPHATAWLNGERWDDEISAQRTAEAFAGIGDPSAVDCAPAWKVQCRSLRHSPACPNADRCTLRQTVAAAGCKHSGVCESLGAHRALEADEQGARLSA